MAGRPLKQDLGRVVDNVIDLGGQTRSQSFWKHAGPRVPSPLEDMPFGGGVVHSKYSPYFKRAKLGWCVYSDLRPGEYKRPVLSIEYAQGELDAAVEQFDEVTNGDYIVKPEPAPITEPTASLSELEVQMEKASQQVQETLTGSYIMGKTVMYAVTSLMAGFFNVIPYASEQPLLAFGFTVVGAAVGGLLGNRYEHQMNGFRFPSSTSHPSVYLLEPLSSP